MKTEARGTFWYVFQGITDLFRATPFLHVDSYGVCLGERTALGLILDEGMVDADDEEREASEMRAGTRSMGKSGIAPAAQYKGRATARGHECHGRDYQNARAFGFLMKALGSTS